MMALADITRASVERAIAEFDELERDAFLRRYGFGRGRGYFIAQNGHKYDSKAVAGAAHGFLGDGKQPLVAKDFSGGEQSVARVLRALGFDVLGPDAVGISIPYERGRTYHRQRDIHQVFGGQERGGIATPADAPFVFLFTGEGGSQFGYEDNWGPDGSFDYTGEGQRGGMQFIRGNRAIRDHDADGKDLLLFKAAPQKGLYTFEGMFGCAAAVMATRPDVDGQEREAIVFQLVPVGDERENDEPPPPTMMAKSLDDLRQLAYAAATMTPTGISGDVRRNYYLRKAAVKAYVLKRAGGTCEACGSPAPFQRNDGTPYLEPHHTRRLADGGPDHPRWVGAVCPTCHRKIHHGSGGDVLNEKLQTVLAQREGAESKADFGHPPFVFSK